MKTFRTTLKAVGLLLSVGLLAFSSGSASASIPDSNGVYHGCLSTNGNIYLIDPSLGVSCSNKTTSVTWSQTGPEGPVGPVGATGAAGATGAIGP